MNDAQVTLMRRQARSFMRNRYALTVVSEGTTNPYGEVIGQDAIESLYRLCQFVPKGQFRAGPTGNMIFDDPTLFVPFEEKPEVGSTIADITDLSGKVQVMEGPITIVDVQPADDMITQWRVTLSGVRPAPLVG